MLLNLKVVGSFVFVAALMAQGCSSSSSPDNTVAAGDTTGETTGSTTGNTTGETTGETTEMVSNTPRNWVAELSTVAHDVSGTVRVIDNCTLQIDNFTYDGRGPSVYFWGAVNRDYTGPDYFQIGDRIDGTPYDNETVVIDIPENKTLDDFDSLSVWCFQFGQNFGDAMWNSNP